MHSPYVVAQALERTASIGEPVMFVRPTFALATLPCDDFSVSDNASSSTAPSDSDVAARAAEALLLLPDLSTTDGVDERLLPASARPSSAYGHIPKPVAGRGGESSRDSASRGRSCGGSHAAEGSASHTQHRGAFSNTMRSGAAASLRMPTPGAARRTTPSTGNASAASTKAPAAHKTTSGRSNDNNTTAAAARRRALAMVCGPLAFLLKKPRGSTSATCITTSAPTLASVVPLVGCHVHSVLGNRLEHAAVCNTLMDGLALLHLLFDPVVAFQVEVTSHALSMDAALLPTMTRRCWRHLGGFHALLCAPATFLADMLGSIECAGWIAGLGRGGTKGASDGGGGVGSAARTWLGFQSLLERFVPRETDVAALVRSMAVILLALELRLTVDADGFVQPASTRDAEGLEHLAQLLGDEWAPEGEDPNGRALLHTVKTADDPLHRNVQRICFVADEVVQFMQQWLVATLNEKLQGHTIGHQQRPHVVVAVRANAASAEVSPDGDVAGTGSASPPRRHATPQLIGGGLRSTVTRPGDAISIRELPVNLAAEYTRAWMAEALELKDDAALSAEVVAPLSAEYHRHKPTTRGDGARACHDSDEVDADAAGPAPTDAARESCLAALLLCGCRAGEFRKHIDRHYDRVAPLAASRVVKIADDAHSAAVAADLIVEHSFGTVRYADDVPLHPPRRSSTAASSTANAASKSSGYSARRGPTPRPRRDHTTTAAAKATAVPEDVVYDEERRLAAHALQVLPAIRRILQTARLADEAFFVHVVPSLPSGHLPLHDATASIAASLVPRVIAVDNAPRIAQSLPHATFCGEFFRYLEDTSTLKRLQEASDGGLDDRRFVELVCRGLELPLGSFTVTVDRVDLTAEAVRVLEQHQDAAAARQSYDAQVRVAEMAVEAEVAETVNRERRRDELAWKRGQDALRVQQQRELEVARNRASRERSPSASQAAPPPVRDASADADVPPWRVGSLETTVRLTKAAASRIKRSHSPPAPAVKPLPRVPPTALHLSHHVHDHDEPDDSPFRHHHHQQQQPYRSTSRRSVSERSTSAASDMHRAPAAPKFGVADFQQMLGRLQT